MTINPVSTNAQSQMLLQDILQAQNSVNQSESQVASGYVSTTYTGMGDKTAMLEAAQSALARTNGYQAATTAALNQSNLQDTQMTQLSNIASELRQDMSEAVANGDGSTLMTQVQGLYSQAVQILNSQDANGNYIYGGNNANTPPVTATSLSQLASLGSVSQAFANGTKAASVKVADGETVQVGMLASGVGTGLMQTFMDIAQFNNGANGNFGQGLTNAQSAFLTNELPTAISAETSVNNSAASNGNVYTQLQDAQNQQQSLSTLYSGFVSNLQDVDMSTAITQLNQNQTALQAALQVTSQIGNISLLNYLAAPSAST
ncbi:MAG: flagellin [Rhizomicrobium sp.]|jgi:flagellar hook-associated protein 3 FlgL